MMLRYVKLLSILVVAACISACGYHFRSAKDMPPGFHQVFIETSTPYTNLVSLLKQQFKSLQVGVVNVPADAKYTLQILDGHFEHDTQNITTSNQAITLSYRLILQFQITAKNGKVVFGPRRLVATRDVILNANQIITNNISPMVKQQLDRRMADLVFDQLMSEQAHSAIGS